jgi:hypothetical protein
MGWTIRNSILGRGKRLSSSSERPDRLWRQPNLLFNGYRCSFPGVKWPGLEVDHSPPPSAEFNNEWSYIFASPPLPFLHIASRQGQAHIYLYLCQDFSVGL